LPSSGGHSPGGHPGPLPGLTSPGTRRTPQKRSEPPTTRRARNRTPPALRSLFFPQPGSYLRLQLYLKRQSPISPVADFCPERRRCWLRAGSLTPTAGRQRATAASTVPVASEARRCRGGLGAWTSTWSAPGLTPWMPAAVPWALDSRCAVRRGREQRALPSLSGREPRCTSG
jgi:hypothetical protein